MWYEILGLASDADRKTIKRAYASLLKTIDQETEVERFMTVNEAYNEGLRGLEEVIDVLPVESHETDHVDFDLIDEDVYIEEDFHTLYMDQEKRDVVEAWENLITSLDIDALERMERISVSFFNDHFILAPKVFKCIDSHFKLSDKASFMWSFIIEAPHYFEGDLTAKEYELRYLSHYYFLNANFPKLVELVETYKKDIGSYPLMYKYLMIAYYSLGNLKACKECIEQLEDLGIESVSCVYYKSLCLYHEKDYQASYDLIEDSDETMLHSFRSNQKGRALLNLKRIQSPLNWVQYRAATTDYIHYQLKYAPLSRKFFIKKDIKFFLGLYEFLKSTIRWILYISYIISIFVVGFATLPFRYLYGKLTGKNILEEV